MLYAIGIGIAALAVYWLLGMKKMVRMNNDPDQIVLVHLLASAGNGDDQELLAHIKQEGWTSLQVADRVSHALTLAEKLLLPDEYQRAKRYANTQQARYRYGTSPASAGFGSLPRAIANDPHASKSTPAATDAPALETITPAVNESVDNIRERQGFQVNEFVVYPAHGVGQILAIEQQEIAGAKLELFVINFIKDKMTLRVPTAKVAKVGMRKLSDPTTIERAYQTLAQPPQVARVMWSRRALEYEAKINSGDVIAIAEVMRDLYRQAGEEQSYSERQLYDAALDRLSREVAAVQHITDEEAVKECESLVIASAIGRRSK
jgi:CarD family transcriptional regulator, regulator of rRNA transcription